MTMQQQIKTNISRQLSWWIALLWKHPLKVAMLKLKLCQPFIDDFLPFKGENVRVNTILSMKEAAMRLFDEFYNFNTEKLN